MFGLFLSAVIPAAAENPGGRVISDIDPLRSVLILPPSRDERREIYGLYDDSPLLVLNYWDGMIRQHRELTSLLKRNGVRTLNIIDLLDSAVANARRQGKLEAALAEIFPEEFPRLKDRIDKIAAQVLLGRSAQFYFQYNGEGGLDPLIPLCGAFIYCRDFAVSTPQGIILTNSRYRGRRPEHRLGRFMFRYADELRGHAIAFDAEAEGVRCEGGDIIVQDERTILMGVGNRSDRDAARKIAQKLGMDVIGVSMPPHESPSGVNLAILHLDTVFNLVDRKKALSVPYLFFRKFAADNPIGKYLKAIDGQPKKELGKGELDFPSSMKSAIGTIPKVGWLTLFRSGTGDATELEEKLGDYLVGKGYEIIPVGGEQGDMSEDQYIDERVLYELSLQGCNIVQLAPGKVIAFAHNTYTNRALRQRGIQVLTVEGKYLADSLGGPHCLTMPLVRDASGAR
jgi:arginine deiminase